MTTDHTPNCQCHPCVAVRRAAQQPCLGKDAGGRYCTLPAPHTGPHIGKEYVLDPPPATLEDACAEKCGDRNGPSFCALPANHAGPHRCGDIGWRHLVGGAGHSPYYLRGGVEAIDVIEAWELGFNLGNVVKYLARAGHKSTDAREDLEKARWYLDREIARLSAEHNK